MPRGHGRSSSDLPLSSESFSERAAIGYNDRASKVYGGSRTSRSETRKSSLGNSEICRGDAGISEPSYDRTKTVRQEWRPKVIQKGWRYDLCPVSTTSELCLEEHPEGKKHMTREKQLEAEKSVMSSRNSKRNNGISFPPPDTEPVPMQWVKPSFQWMKLNTDGSKNKKNVGFGGLVRDDKGHPLYAFAHKWPGEDIFMLELLAVERGLHYAKHYGIRKIWVESDSLSVVETINWRCSYSQKAASCLNEIESHLQNFQKYKVSHSWRETNRAADYLAKMDIPGSYAVLDSTQFPEELSRIIEDDASGTIYWREVRKK